MFSFNRINTYIFLFTIIFLGFGCELNNETTSLYNIFKNVQEFQNKESPISATYSGIHKYNNFMPFNTNNDFERRLLFWQKTIEQLNDININNLSSDDKINYSIFYDMVIGNINKIKFKDYQMPLNADSGFHTGLSRLYKAMPFKTKEDYDNYINRLNQFPRFFNEHINNMREGIKEGRTIPQVVLKGYEVTITTHIVKSAEESAFFNPFQSLPESLNEEEKKEVYINGKKSVLENVIPAFQSFLNFFEKEYFPNARKTLGAFELPNGDEFYQYKIKQFTTLDLTADVIHEIGLKEVERIRKEMEKIISDLKFNGSFDQFLNFLY